MNPKYHYTLNIFLFIFLIFFSTPSFTQKIAASGEANLNVKTHLPSLKKWQNMRYGMFIHWGPVSLRGTEIGWSRGREVPIAEYDTLYKEFNPILFNAKEWVGIAKEAGMKYIIITSKHHDGFCIWDSKYTDYDIMATPFKRDILKELSDECRRQGILFGTYHSIADWHHPHYTTRYGGDPRPVEQSDMNQYIIYLKNQVKELIEEYHTNVLWFDGEWEDSWDHEKGLDLYRYARGLRDDILINNRVDKGRKGMQGMSISDEFAGDFGTPEQEIGAFELKNPWESCITICQQWAWKPNDRMKSLKECIQTLARTAGGGGNLLLNVGPMLDGRIEQRQITRLKEVGRWLEKYGESIYGTQGGPFKPNSWMVSTRKANKIYLHLFGWPEQHLKLSESKNTNVLSAKILNGSDLKYSNKNKEIWIELPDKPVDANNTIIVLTLNNNASEIEPLDVPINVLSNVHHSNLKLLSKPSSRYSARGSESLTDKERGSKNYNDGHWLGFEESNFEVVVDLLGEKTIKLVSLGCLQDQNVWIFFPKKLEVLISNNGTDFKKVGEKKVNLNSDSKAKVKDFSFSFEDLTGHYIKIIAYNIGKCPDWHKGAGGKTWLFIDEIQIK